ncbi:class I SAM-dependent methyltransferase [Paenibacillus endoradicis]|uniref:class I SAM-dependent methyltransferase n=1 Tax=Paenibacillus endoradicis TaxID=2972487 RepID=UPI0021598997|nr:class I SAM-dependent methyltransferase [Paenibacillus endoradicis]MCR8656477.1 methyltransferase domain-containing protein [Paenibacillus endoradicis]
MNSELSNNNSNPESNHYQLNFVTSLGADAMFLLQPQKGERILDLCCGNGNLTAQIAAAGAIPTGIDLSEDMIKRAKGNYPDLNIHVADATQYRTDTHFDAVFSNAAIHWIKDAPAVASSIWLALRDGGRFVAEFAASGNIAVITNAIKQELQAHGYEWEGRNPWYFPTIGEYTSLLEQTGFRVMFAQHFDKLSPLKGDGGIRRWLDGFNDHFFHDVSSTDKASIYNAIEDRVKPQLEQDGQWLIDTSRMRIIAIKI